MDRRIAIQANTPTRNDYGEEIEGWSTIATVWAEKIENRGQERFQSAQFIGKEAVSFRFRWSETVKAVTAKHRVVFDGRIFEIVGGPRELGRREGIEVDCTVRSETPVDNA